VDQRVVAGRAESGGGVRGRAEGHREQTVLDGLVEDDRVGRDSQRHGYDGFLSRCAECCDEGGDHQAEGHELTADVQGHVPLQSRKMLTPSHEKPRTPHYLWRWILGCRLAGAGCRRPAHLGPSRDTTPPTTASGW